MVNRFLINQKGQSSIEFLILIVILLVFVQTIIQPSLQDSLLAARDTQRVGQITLAAQKLTGNIEQIYSISGDSKTTTYLFLPENSKIVCNAVTKTLTSQVQLEHPETLSACPNQVCSKTYSLPSNINLTCTNLESNLSTQIQLVIEKVQGVVHVTQTD
ncbi:MAG: hypothetical protein Q7S92_01810 [Candidatus Diapherotrites archaeon]|nr:hypothetical protein [Candidatus Diapherotrites archaeon]